MQFRSNIYKFLLILARLIRLQKKKRLKDYFDVHEYILFSREFIFNEINEMEQHMVRTVK